MTYALAVLLFIPVALNLAQILLCANVRKQTPINFIIKFLIVAESLRIYSQQPPVAREGENPFCVSAANTPYGFLSFKQIGIDYYKK